MSPSPSKRRLIAILAILAMALLLAPPGAVAHGQEPIVTPTAEDASANLCEGAGLLRPVCEVGRVGIEAGGAAAGAVVLSGAEAALRAIVEWVVGGAAWLLGELAELIDSSTRPDVRQGWFSVAYRDMATVAVLLMLPLFLLSVVQALARQSLDHLVRAAVLYLPVAAVGMFAAVAVVDQVVVVTDELSAWVGRSLGTDLTGFATTVGTALTEVNLASAPTAATALPGFAALLGALVVGFASFVIWVLLVLRQAAIYVAVLFLPLGFAALVWPATAHWLRRLVEGLVAVVLAKFVIVAVMAMAANALAAAGEQGFGVVVSGGALLLLAAFAPFVLLRLIPVFESGLAGQLDGVTTQRTSPVPGPTAHGVYQGVQRARAASAARTGGSFASSGAASAALAGAATGGVATVAAGAARAEAAVRSAPDQIAQAAAAASGSGSSPAGDAPTPASHSGQAGRQPSGPPSAHTGHASRDGAGPTTPSTQHHAGPAQGGGRVSPPAPPAGGPRPGGPARPPAPQAPGPSADGASSPPPDPGGHRASQPRPRPPRPPAPPPTRRPEGR